ncbi:MAG: hypothetical protein ACTSYS_00655, partial [Promethearchaeota archaeon]
PDEVKKIIEEKIQREFSKLDEDKKQSVPELKNLKELRTEKDLQKNQQATLNVNEGTETSDARHQTSPSKKVTPQNIEKEILKTRNTTTYDALDDESIVKKQFILKEKELKKREEEINKLILEKKDLELKAQELEMERDEMIKAKLEKMRQEIKRREELLKEKELALKLKEIELKEKRLKEKEEKLNGESNEKNMK